MNTMTVVLTEPNRRQWSMNVTGDDEDIRHLGVVMEDAVNAGDLSYANYIDFDPTRPVRTCANVEEMILDIRRGKDETEPPYGWQPPQSRFDELGGSR